MGKTYVRILTQIMGFRMVYNVLGKFSRPKAVGLTKIFRVDFGKTAKSGAPPLSGVGWWGRGGKYMCRM